MGFKLQHQPNLWSCVPTAFAMCFDVSVSRVIEMVGHDGSEIHWPKLLGPHKYRGFHLQEMVGVGFLLNYAVLIIASEIQMYSDDSADTKTVTSFLGIQDYMKRCDGVLLGIWPNGSRHAVAYSKGVCFDPSGDVYTLQPDVQIRVFCPVLKSNHF